MVTYVEVSITCGVRVYRGEEFKAVSVKKTDKWTVGHGGYRPVLYH